MPPDVARRLQQYRQVSEWLDSAFRVPGTRIRFGWDPIIGLVPGFGDLSSPVFAAMLLLQARRMRIPRIVQLRMLFNALFDALLGMIPVAGWIADVGWKANVRNMQLLERHAEPGVPPGRGDVIFVYLVLLGLLWVAIAPIVMIVLALRATGII
jgi:hypothetical protein